MNFERVKAVCVSSFLISLFTLTGFGNRTGISDSAWDRLLQQDPAAVDDESIS